MSKRSRSRQNRNNLFTGHAFRKWALLLCTLPVLAITISSCGLLNNDDEEEDKHDMLYVKFINEAASAYTITTIQLQKMGVAGEDPDPSGVWNSDILSDGTSIAPGGIKYFNLQIDNLHWCQYRLGVDDGTGNEIMLHVQENIGDNFGGSITHWGSDDRTCSVMISKDETSGLIYVSGWSDFAGIED